jgi:hypothetical protein
VHWVFSNTDLVVASIFFATNPETECSRSRISPVKGKQSGSFFHKTDRFWNYLPLD